MDLQAYPLPSATGNFAFTLSGADSGYQAVGYGGVFSVSQKTISGIADVNDDGVFTPGTAGNFTGPATGADSYGRATATVTVNTTTQLDLAAYIVGAEVVRIIDVDAGGTGGAARRLAPLTARA